VPTRVRICWGALLSAIVIALVVVATSAQVHAQGSNDAVRCKEAYEGSQENRHAFALLSARKKLRFCAGEACSDEMRTDCITWLAEVDRAIPTIVFEAKVDGQQVTDVTVTMDGNPATRKLDGRPIEIDPGNHVFVFQKQGRTPVEQTVLVLEQRKNLVVAASWETPVAVPAETSRSSGAWRTAGIIVGGVGVAGLVVGSVFGANALSTDKSAMRDCAAPTRCTSAGVDLAHTAHDDATVSTVAFAAGGVLAAGGALLVVLSPRLGRTQGMNLTPSFTATSQMLVISGAF
jgi:hypothetical protein